MEREGPTQPHEREGPSVLEQKKEGKERGKVGYIKNTHIEGLSEDVLYHLALGSASHDLGRMFHDVKYVIMGGTPRRMEALARYLRDELKIQLPTGTDICDISHRSYRYALFKVGPVISVSHGMGIPSMSILLHEIVKLVHHAKCKDVTFIRIGTCGGIGIPGGSLVISKETINSKMQPELKLHVIGKTVRRPAIVDAELAQELYDLSRRELPHYTTVMGKTMCTNDFYEGQGRLDGAFCDYTATEKMAFLRRLQKNGVTNMEMESVGFSASCYHAGIKCAVVCAAIVDRLRGDQVRESRETLEEWQHRPQELLAKFIAKREMK